MSEEPTSANNGAITDIEHLKAMPRAHSLSIDAYFQPYSGQEPPPLETQRRDISDLYYWIGTKLHSEGQAQPINVSEKHILRNVFYAALRKCQNDLVDIGRNLGAITGGVGHWDVKLYCPFDNAHTVSLTPDIMIAHLHDMRAAAEKLAAPDEAIIASDPTRQGMISQWQRFVRRQVLPQIDMAIKREEAQLERIETLVQCGTPTTSTVCRDVRAEIERIGEVRRDGRE